MNWIFSILIIIVVLTPSCSDPQNSNSIIRDNDSPDMASGPGGSEIAYGELAETGDAPWQVSLYSMPGPPILTHFCGGSILDSFWILTACHCIFDGTRQKKSNEFKIYYNSIFLDSLGITSNVDTIIPHPKYNPRNNDYDVALIKLLNPIRFNGVSSQSVKVDPSIRPDELPDESSEAFVSGWGDLNYDRQSAQNQLLKIIIPLVKFKDCIDMNGQSAMTSRMFCAGEPWGGKSPCFKDSGGALVVKFNNTPHQIGIVCKTFKCGLPNKYPIFTNLHGDIGNWVFETIKTHL